MAISSENRVTHVPMINARRGYVFAAIYDEEYKEILKPQHITITELKKELDSVENYEVITNDELEDFSTRKEYNPNIGKIIDYFKDKEVINPHAVNPEYLKLTEAEESKL